MTKVLKEQSVALDKAARVGVLVLGMHRSGTSALARVLSLLGCDLPKTLMQESSTNEAGHWESNVLMQLNDEILDSAGTDWHDWLSFNPGWYASPKVAEFRERGLFALQEEFNASRLFVLKDPRNCRFAPFWLDVFETAGVRPAVILPVRNPLEVAESLAKRDGINPALGHLLWLRHVLEAEATTRGLQRFHCSYDGLLNSWPRLISAMQEKLGISWPRFSTKVSEEIDAFLTDRLRHHRESPKSVSDNPLLSAWLRDTFAIFHRWSEEGEAKDDHATLDRIRGELDVAAPAFASLISAGRQSEQKANALDARLKEAQGKLGEAEAAVAAHEQQLQDSERQLEEVRAELSHTQSALAQRSAEADETAAQLKETERRLAAELEAERVRLSEAEASRLVEAERANQLAAELEQVNSENRETEDRLTANLEKAISEKHVAEDRLAERFSEIAVMTRLIGETETAAKLSEEQAAWLREVSAVLMNGAGSETLKGRLAALLPAPIRLKKQKARLKREGVFDADAYLAAHADVAESGIDPLWHYINHGIGEGRQRG